jgi:chorismate mutase
MEEIAENGEKKLALWWKTHPGPLLIAGPCSAEDPGQLRGVVETLSRLNVPYIRAGVWKPRTRPGSFEGRGPEALEWIRELSREFGVAFATEVAKPEHIDLALKADIGLLWIGARTTVNPFAVQELAEALRGTDIPVLVKNPINPDPALWLGAIERLEKSGLKRTGAIHRGFSSMQESNYRNAPIWQIPLELKSQRPDLPLICDPSHIGGRRDLVAGIAQMALDLSYDGLMVETHPHPDLALSDAAQQWPLDQMEALLATLVSRDRSFKRPEYINRLDEIRAQIDHADRELLEALTRRMKLVDEVGKYKKENNVAIFQIQRWKEVFRTRPEWAKSLGLDEKTVMDLYRLIHQASIKRQTELFDKDEPH